MSQMSELEAKVLEQRRALKQARRGRRTAPVKAIIAGQHMREATREVTRRRSLDRTFEGDAEAANGHTRTSVDDESRLRAYSQALRHTSSSQALIAQQRTPTYAQLPSLGAAQQPLPPVSRDPLSMQPGEEGGGASSSVLREALGVPVAGQSSAALLRSTRMPAAASPQRSMRELPPLPPRQLDPLLQAQCRQPI